MVSNLLTRKWTGTGSDESGVCLPLTAVLTRPVSLGALLQHVGPISAWSSSILSGIGEGRMMGLERHGGRLCGASWCNDKTRLYEVLELFHTRGGYPVTSLKLCHST